MKLCQINHGDSIGVQCLPYLKTCLVVDVNVIPRDV